MGTNTFLAKNVSVSQLQFCNFTSTKSTSLLRVLSRITIQDHYPLFLVLHREKELISEGKKTPSELESKRAWQGRRIVRVS